MKLTEEEIDALKAYFDVTNVNITSLIKKIGLKKVKIIQEVINNIFNE
jgi:tRNA A37 threonylcarbamoyladenosine dehydratase